MNLNSQFLYIYFLHLCCFCNLLAMELENCKLFDSELTSFNESVFLSEVQWTLLCIKKSKELIKFLL